MWIAWDRTAGSLASDFAYRITHALVTRSRGWIGMFVVCLSVITCVRPCEAEIVVVTEGHLDLGVAYDGSRLSWVYNAAGASIEGGGTVPDDSNLFLPNQMAIRVPDGVRIDGPAFPGNPAVTGHTGAGPMWVLFPGSPGPDPGFAYNFGLSSTHPQFPLELIPSDWSNLTISMTAWSMPANGNFSLYLGSTNFFSTFDPGITNAPNVPNGSNSMLFPSHEHYFWAFTAEGLYDITFTANGTHSTDGPKSATGTYRFLVGDATAVPEPGSIALLCAGTVGVIGGIRRRRRKQIDAEPATE